MNRITLLELVAASTLAIATAQTSMPGNYIVNGIYDSSTAVKTIPMRTGTVAARPATCTVGEMYFATDAISGQNVFGCPTTNTWVLQSYPITSGTIAARPATCTVGQLYYATDASAGQNLYGCTATNVWTVQAGGGGGGATTNGTNGQALISNGSGGFGTPVTLATSATVDATNATNISAGTLSAARLPSTLNNTFTFTGQIDAKTANSTAPAKTGTNAARPATCIVGELYYSTDATAGQNLFGCTATNTWTAQAGGGPASALANSVLASLPTPCTANDVRLVPDATVSGGGNTLYVCLGAAGWKQQGYTAGGSGAISSNCTTFPCEIDVTAIVPLKTAANVFSGANDFSGASKTAPVRIGASDPGTCDPTSREMFFNSTSNLLKACTSANTWSSITGGGGGGGSFGTGAYWAPHGTDIGGSTDIYTGNGGLGSAMCVGIVPPLSGTFTKVALRVDSWPSSGGMGLSIGVYSSAGSRLAYASAATPGTGNNQVMTLNTSLSLTAGTLYYECTATEGTMAIYKNSTFYSGFLLAMTGTSDALQFLGNAATGTGATFAVPTTIGTHSASNTYLTYPTTVYLP